MKLLVFLCFQKHSKFYAKQIEKSQLKKQKLIPNTSIKRKKKLNLFSETISQNRILASSMSETPSIANIMSKQNSEPNYPAVRVQNNNLSFSSVDSVKFKMEGNGKNWIFIIISSPIENEYCFLSQAAHN